MPKPSKTVTPENRVPAWKKLWSAPRLLSDDETEAAFEQFQEAFIPSHMRSRFLKQFGLPKAEFGNRYFMEDAGYQKWDTKLSLLGASGTHVEVTVIYASPDALEAHWLRGETRRTLRDVVVDDWHGACVIVKAEDSTIYVFVEPKMKGCMVRIVPNEPGQ